MLRLHGRVGIKLRQWLLQCTTRRVQLTWARVLGCLRLGRAEGGLGAVAAVRGAEGGRRNVLYNEMIYCSVCVC